VVVALWLAACSGKPQLTVGDYENQYCALMMPCCAAGQLATDGVMCHQLISAAAASGGGAFDAAAGTRCLASMRQAGAALCGGSSSDPVCQLVFPHPPGTLPPGATCSSDTQCAPPASGKAVCYPTFDTTTGAPTSVCAIELTGQAGDGPCLATLEGNLSATLWQPTDGPLPATGYTCDRGAGLVCTSAKTCIPLRSIGDACGGSIECADGAYCDVVTQVCTVRGAVGAPCTTDGACVDAAYCDLQTGCASRLALGAPCTPTGPRCPASAACTSGTCQASPDFGLMFFCGV
jgi:hypothetical protein